jgi:hypothetical protein
MTLPPDPISEIAFVFQSINAGLAKKVDFRRFQIMVEYSPYFKEKFVPTSINETEIQFPKRIVIHSPTGSPPTALGQNVFGGVVDEVYFVAKEVSTSMTGHSRLKSSSIFIVQKVNGDDNVASTT